MRAGAGRLGRAASAGPRTYARLALFPGDGALATAAPALRTPTQPAGACPEFAARRELPLRLDARCVRALSARVCLALFGTFSRVHNTLSHCECNETANVGAPGSVPLSRSLVAGRLFVDDRGCPYCHYQFVKCAARRSWCWRCGTRASGRRPARGPACELQLWTTAPMCSWAARRRRWRRCSRGPRRALTTSVLKWVPAGGASISLQGVRCVLPVCIRVALSECLWRACIPPIERPGRAARGTVRRPTSGLLAAGAARVAGAALAARAAGGRRAGRHLLHRPGRPALALGARLQARPAAAAAARQNVQLPCLLPLWPTVAWFRAVQCVCF